MKKSPKKPPISSRNNEPNEPVLVVPNDPLHQGLEKLRLSMTGREWVERLTTAFPLKTPPSSSQPQESRGPSIERGHPTDAENEEDERIANARGRRRY